MQTVRPNLSINTKKYQIYTKETRRKKEGARRKSHSYSQSFDREFKNHINIYFKLIGILRYTYQFKNNQPLNNLFKPLCSYVPSFPIQILPQHLLPCGPAQIGLQVHNNDYTIQKVWAKW